MLKSNSLLAPPKAKSGLKGVQSLLMYKDGDSGLQRGGSLRTPSLTSRSDRLQQRLPITQHFGQVRSPCPHHQCTHLELSPGPPPSPISIQTSRLPQNGVPTSPIHPPFTQPPILRPHPHCPNLSFAEPAPSAQQETPAGRETF